MDEIETYDYIPNGGRKVSRTVCTTTGGPDG